MISIPMYVRERLNVGTVPTFKMHHVGTVPTFKMHHVGTLEKYNCIKLICYYQSIQCEPSEPIPLYLQLNQFPSQVTVSWD